MEPEFKYNLNRNFELRVTLFFLAILILLLGSYTQKKLDENKSLKATMELLQTSIEQQKDQNRQQFDSLQQLIQHQDKVHLRLRDSLSLLKIERQRLKSRSNENKAAIHRIHDVDSLYHVVARHYRQQ